MEPVSVSHLPVLHALTPLAGEGLAEQAVLVDLDRATESKDAVLDVDPGSGRLLVGVATRPPGRMAIELARALDVTYVPVDSAPVDRATVPVADPRAAADRAAAQVASTPGAALTLAGLLRATEGMDARRALVVESFAYSMLLAGSEYLTWLRTRERRPQPTPLVGPLVRPERRGEQLDVVLDHPQRRNAYSARLRDELHEALRIARLDHSITKVTLSGAGPSFSAGGDLDEFGTVGDPVVAHVIRTTAGVATSLEALRPRLEVHVHGPCVGAGIEIAAFGSRVVARADTAVRLPEVLMGLLPGAGGTVSIARRVGRWRLIHLCLSGEQLDVRRALDWGLVDEVEE